MPEYFDNSTTSTNDRYGLFNVLDHRSIYGKNWYPEPLLADEADVDNEIRADWLHTERNGEQADDVSVEFEKSFGLLTLEIAPSYESDHVSSFNHDTGKTEHDNEQGLGNIEFGFRFPVYQYVSPNGFFDTTLVFGMEITVPTKTDVSQDFEFVPKIFDLMRFGDHLSVQLGLGDSILDGPAAHGLSTLEYDFVVGYELDKKTLPIPGLLSVVPLFEVDGEYTLNQEDARHNELLGAVGARLNFDSISWLPAQPRIALGYVFPIDQGGRDDLRWGIVTSIVFEY